MSSSFIYFYEFEKKSFLKCDNISIDISVFEKTKKAFVIPLNCGWNDIGSWESLWKISKKDIKGNSTHGRVLIKDTKDSFIRSEDKLVVSIGLENIIVVETKDAFLVANIKCLEKLKDGLLPQKWMGKKIAPIKSYAGFDIDYDWQFPLLEHRLRINGHKFKKK